MSALMRCVCVCVFLLIRSAVAAVTLWSLSSRHLTTITASLTHTHAYFKGHVQVTGLGGLTGDQGQRIVLQMVFVMTEKAVEKE